MKLAVFGASGRTGKPFVQQALDAGHEVRALVRTPGKLGLTHPKLTLIQGDAKDAAKIEETIRGADVVVSALGPVKGEAKDFMTVAAQHLVTAMKRAGVRRLITLTGAGVDQPGDAPKLVNHVIKFALKTLSPDVLKDSEGHVRTITTSDLDWTVVRVPMLTDGPSAGSVKVGMVGVGTGPRISRVDVATFLLRQVESGAHLRQAPVISH